MANEHSGQRNGVGASVLRKEDDRHLRGRGQFVADIALRGTQEVVFLRSPHAHARIRSISVPPACAAGYSPRRDLPRMKPIRVVTQAAGARSPPWPPLATDKVRYVGEAIAACVAPTRAEAEDLAAAVDVDYQPLDAVVDAPAVARRQSRPRARILGRQPVPRADDRGRRHRCRRARRRDHRQPRIPHEPAVRRADGGPRRARLSRPPARRGRGLRLDPDAAHDARRARRDPRARGAPHPRRRARCRRRVWAEGPALSGGDHPRRAGAGTRPPGALDRGPQRASADRARIPATIITG